MFLTFGLFGCAPMPREPENVFRDACGHLPAACAAIEHRH
jgi:hypothetical protein